MLSVIISAIASFVLALTHDFPVFVLGNLLMGLGTGLYWPPNEAMVADLTTPVQRNEAFALTRLCDSLGLGIGVVLGGLLVGATGAYRSLFVIDGISFLLLLAILFWVIAESGSPRASDRPFDGWATALRDRRLLTYSVANILFTTYMVQLVSTLPLYLTNFVPLESGKGFSPQVISALFAWHLGATVLIQLPTVRLLNRFTHPQGMMISGLLWVVGFGLIGWTGVSPGWHLLWAILAMAVTALATAAYMPSAASTTVQLAPDELRGVYLAVNSQCWAIGYLLGPPIGGWALDQAAPIAHGFWLGMASTVVVALLILKRVDRMVTYSEESSYRSE